MTRARLLSLASLALGALGLASLSWVEPAEAQTKRTVYMVQIQANNGQFVVAENNGGGAVNANRAKAGQWETFVLFDLNGGELVAGDKVRIRTTPGYFFVAEGGGGREVKANRVQGAEWETFTILKVGGTGIIRLGDPIAFLSHNNKLVVAEGGGGGVVNANRDKIGPWETFKFKSLTRVTLPFFVDEPLAPKPAPKPAPTPSSPPSSGTPSVPGHVYLGTPKCDTKWATDAMLRKDARGYFCCTGQNAGAGGGRCGPNKREFPADCTQWSPHGVLIQPGGCYRKVN